MSILTPAEVLGLSGLSLDSRVRRVFYNLPQDTAADLCQRIEQAAWDRKLWYLHDGRDEAIHVFPRPILALPDQLAYLHYVSLTILNALKRLPDLYMQDFAVREMFPLAPAEQQWLWDNWGVPQRENNTVLGRLDAVVEFTSPMWKDSLKFLEPNLCGVGGIWLGPTCEQLLADLVLPIIRAADPDLDLEPLRDLRELFIQEVLDHMEAIGRRGRNICFIEPKYAGEGPDEQQALADYYHERHGLRVMHADPCELEIVGDEVCYLGEPIDVAYRDYEVRDLISLAVQTGNDLAPVRKLFRENRVISSLAGEFDHKSCWELLTDPQLTNKYFTADERQIFRRHILWTRILTDRQTNLPDGDWGELLEFVRGQRDILVLKPNRSYGGAGVLIGQAISQEEWEHAIDEAVASPDRWVVQRQAILPVNEFPVVGPDGNVHDEPFYTVMGFAPTKHGLAILGRASQKQVVNVAQRGGMCGVFSGRPALSLVGPNRTARRG